MFAKKTVLSLALAMSFGCASWLYAADEENAKEHVIEKLPGIIVLEGEGDLREDLLKKIEGMKGETAGVFKELERAQYLGHFAETDEIPVSRGTAMEAFDFNHDGKLESFESEAYFANSKALSCALKWADGELQGAIKIIEGEDGDFEDAIEGMEKAKEELQKQLEEMRKAAENDGN